MAKRNASEPKSKKTKRANTNRMKATKKTRGANFENFSIEQMKKYPDKFQSLLAKERTKLLRAEWRKLSAAEKKHYNQPIAEGKASSTIKSQESSKRIQVQAAVTTDPSQSPIPATGTKTGSKIRTAPNCDLPENPSSMKVSSKRRTFPQTDVQDQPISTKATSKSRTAHQPNTQENPVNVKSSSKVRSTQQSQSEAIKSSSMKKSNTHTMQPSGKMSMSRKAANHQDDHSQHDQATHQE